MLFISATGLLGGFSTVTRGCIVKMRSRDVAILRLLFTPLLMRKVVSDETFLTPEEVSTRYRGEVSVGTLRNWRAMRVGPAFVKIGKAVLYPVSELESWDRANLVSCRTVKPSRGTQREDG
jgi:hypothetical protein